MLVSLLNKSGGVLSTPFGSISNGVSLARDLDEQEYIKLLPELNALENKGYIVLTLAVGQSKEADHTTTADTTIYVDANLGKDTNTGSSMSPLRTVQAAIDRVPKRIQHYVKISCAAGSYSGFLVDGFTIESRGISTAGLHIQGQLINATLSTGSATGTLTSVTTGNSTDPVWTVFTDSTQAWTTDNLKGRFVEILTGTGAGTVVPITSNTATALTVLATAATSATNATYAIRDCGAVIDSSTPLASRITLMGAAAIAAGSVCIGVLGNSSQTRTAAWSLVIEGFKIVPPTNFIPVRVQDNAGLVLLDIVQIVGPTGGVSIEATGAGLIRLVNVIMSGSSTCFGSGASSSSLAPNFQLANCLFHSNTTTGILCGGQSLNSITTCHIESSIGISITGGGAYSISSCQIVTGTLQGIRTRDVSGNAGMFGFAVIDVVLSTISNRSIAIDVQGPTLITNRGKLTGTANTTIFNLARGARAVLNSASDIAGTNEIILDGAAAQTFAAMRAASPKLLTNTYGTIIYE